MPDIDRESRTHPPTPRRREQAREEGQVARSTEINTAVVILAGLAVGLWAMPALLARERVTIGDWFRLAGTLELDVETVPLVFGRMGRDLGALCLPLLAAAVVAGLTAQISQGGVALRLQKLAPDIGRLSPLKGLQRIVSVDGAVTLGKSAVKLCVIGYVAYRVVLRSGRGAEELVLLDVPAVVRFVGGGIRDTVLWVGVALAVLAVLDYAYARYRTERDLMMTRQEVEDELKATEGDVKVKRRFRKFHYELTKNRMLAEVPTADVVLTNPVHVAVALRYVADTMRAPRVVAKGAGDVAEEIKRIARGAGVPIVERRALARALFRSVKVGQEIPAALYRAVAEVLAYIYSLQRRPAAADGAR